MKIEVKKDPIDGGNFYVKIKVEGRLDDLRKIKWKDLL